MISSYGINSIFRWHECSYLLFFDIFQTSRNSKSTSKRAAKSYERPGLSEEEIEEIREAFNLFDTDGSGKWNF